MNKSGSPAGRIKLGMGIALATLLMGCVGGYVDGGYDGGVVVAPAPDTFIFGGGYVRDRDARNYSHRGAESRGAAHPRGGERRR